MKNETKRGHKVLKSIGIMLLILFTVESAGKSCCAAPVQHPKFN